MNRLKVQDERNKAVQQQQQQNEAVNFTNQNKCEYCMRACVRV